MKLRSLERLSRLAIIPALILFMAFAGCEDSTDENTDDDHGDTAATATVVAINTTASGTLDTADDIDYFVVTLSEGGRLVIYTTGSANTVGSLRNSSDIEIESDDQSGDGDNFRIDRYIASGTYYIRVTGSDSATGDYTLHVEFAPEEGDTAATAETIELASSVSAAIHYTGDADYFKITIESTGYLDIYTTGSTDTLGSFRDSEDTEISSNDDGEVPPNFYFSELVSPGTYYIKVTESGNDDTGDYTIYVDFFIPPM